MTRPEYKLLYHDIIIQRSWDLVSNRSITDVRYVPRHELELGSIASKKPAASPSKEVAKKEHASYFKLDSDEDIKVDVNFVVKPTKIAANFKLNTDAFDDSRVSWACPGWQGTIVGYTRS